MIIVMVNFSSVSLLCWSFKEKIKYNGENEDRVEMMMMMMVKLSLPAHTALLVLQRENQTMW